MIQSIDQYIASNKECIPYIKTGAVTTIAQFFFSIFNKAGQPGVGLLDVGNTANGLVPTDLTAGYPIINTFTGDTGYLTGLEYNSTVASRIYLYDRLFVCGAYAHNADVTLDAQPSFAGRVPGANYNGLQIWVESVLPSTGNLAVQVNYLDQNGDAGDTGAVGIGAVTTVNRCWNLPLASGDNGVSKIVRVRGSVASGGGNCFNVMVLRPLKTGNIPLAGMGDVYDLLKTGMPKIYDTSALYPLICANSTSSGIPYMNIEIAN